MRALLYIAAMAALYFVAGVYHVISIMALAVAMLLMLAAMLVLARVARRGPHVALTPAMRFAVREGQARLELAVENRSRLPVASFEVELACDYADGQTEPTRLTVSGSIAARRGVTAPVLVQATHCGLVRVRATSLRARDPLGLFAARRRLDLVACLPVVPRRAARLEVAGAPEGLTEQDGPSSPESLTGPEPPEVTQVRPWSPGDALRSIHWKLSARTDETLVRQYEGEHGLDAALVAVFDDTDGRTARDLDDQLEALAGLSLALARAGLRHLLAWQDRDGSRAQAIVLAPDDVLGAVLHVVETGMSAHGPDMTDLISAAPGPVGGRDPVALVLDADLTLTCDGVPVADLAGNVGREATARVIRLFGEEVRR